MMSSINNEKELFIKSTKELEDWLEKNHEQKESIWLIYYKKSSGKSDVSWESIVDLLLCFGWIDNVAGSVDELRTKIRISPRNPKSFWSLINKANIERLTKAGKMRSSGIKMMELAKKTGTWDALNDVENLIVPADLKDKLKIKKLEESWEKLSKSNKRLWLLTLFNAKREETRNKIIEKILQSL
jgi:uncharacterized protein YdeI (YjbR/CyaY-like superfamily)